MSDLYAPLRALFADAGYAFVEPPILHEASVFVELAGEDLRRRLFLTNAADGTELALRPDYTIPVCLHHLATGAAEAAGGLRLSRAGVPPAPERERRVPAGRASSRSGGATGWRPTPTCCSWRSQAATLLGVDEADGADRRLGPVRRRARRARPRRAVAAAPGARLRRHGAAEGADRQARRRQRQARRPMRASSPRSTAPITPPRIASSRTCSPLAGLGDVGGRTADEIAERFLEKAALAAGIGRRPRAGDARAVPRHRRHARQRR